MKNLALNKLLQKQITYGPLDDVLSDFRLWWPAVYGVDWDPERWVDASNNILDIFIDEIETFLKLYDGDWKKNQKIDEWVKNIRKTTFDEIFSCSTDEPNPESFGYEYGEHIEDHLFELFPTFTKARPNSSDFLSRRLDIIISRTSRESKRTTMTEGLFCDTSVIETIGPPVAVDLFKHLISVPKEICRWERGVNGRGERYVEPDLERNLEVVEILKCIERMPMSNLYIIDHPIFHERSTRLLTRFSNIYLSNIGDRELANSGSPKIVPQTGIDIRGGAYTYDRYHACLSLIFNNVNMEIPFWLRWASGFCNSIFYKSNFTNIKYLTEANDLMLRDDEAQIDVSKGRLEGVFADSDIISSQAEIEIMAYWGKDKKMPLQVARRSLFSDSRITFKNHSYDYCRDDIYQRGNNDGTSLVNNEVANEHADNHGSASYGYKGKPLTLVFRDCVFLNTIIDIAPGDEKYFKIKYENCLWP